MSPLGTMETGWGDRVCVHIRVSAPPRATDIYHMCVTHHLLEYTQTHTLTCILAH